MLEITRNDAEICRQKVILEKESKINSCKKSVMRSMQTSRHCITPITLCIPKEIEYEMRLWLSEAFGINLFSHQIENELLFLKVKNL